MRYKNIKINIDEYDSAIKLQLETLLLRIKDRIAYAKKLSSINITLQDGTKSNRLSWIKEAESEQKRVEAELSNFV